LTEDEKRK